MFNINKWEKDYIDNIDLSDIKWIKLNSRELNDFFRANYYDETEMKYVCNIDGSSSSETPFGLYYLSFKYVNSECSFLLGVVTNNIEKKTIVAAIMYLEDCILFDDQKTPVTYIGAVEVNSYFRNQGIYKNMIEHFVDTANNSQHIVLSKESKMGTKCKVFDTLKNIATSKDFPKKVLKDECYGELYSNLCGSTKKMQKR